MNESDVCIILYRVWKQVKYKRFVYFVHTNLSKFILKDTYIKIKLFDNNNYS